MTSDNNGGGTTPPPQSTALSNGQILSGQSVDDNGSILYSIAIPAGATVLTLAMPLLARDDLSTRMKAVAFEREKMRQRERERMVQNSKATLRQSPKAYMQTIVENFNLRKWVGQEAARKLRYTAA